MLTAKTDQTGRTCHFAGFVMRRLILLFPYVQEVRCGLVVFDFGIPWTSFHCFFLIVLQNNKKQLRSE